MNELDKAWLAGFFDAEGTIGVHLSRYKWDTSRYNYYLTASISQVNENIIKWIKTAVGFGSVYKFEKDNILHRDIHSWQCFTKNVLLFCDIIKKYVVYKKRQVDLAIEFGNTMDLGYGQQPKDHIKLTRDRIREEMLKANNYRGIRTFAPETLPSEEIIPLLDNTIDKNLLFSYIAGFFDGDGTINISYSKPNIKYNNTESYSLKIGISQISFRILDWISQIMKNGRICKVNYKEGNWFNQWRLHASGQRAMLFLKQIKPYIKLKKNEIEIAEEFINTKQIIDKVFRRETRELLRGKLKRIHSPLEYTDDKKRVNNKGEYVLSDGTRCDFWGFPLEDTTNVKTEGSPKETA